MRRVFRASASDSAAAGTAFAPVVLVVLVLVSVSSAALIIYEIRAPANGSSSACSRLFSSQLSNEPRAAHAAATCKYKSSERPFKSIMHPPPPLLRNLRALLYISFHQCRLYPSVTMPTAKPTLISAPSYFPLKFP